MAEIKQQIDDANVAEAKRIQEEEELGLRRPQGLSRWLIPTIALCWSLFQLSLSSWLLLDSTKTRAVHLAFALLLVFTSYPTLRREVKIPGLRWLGEKHRIPVVDLVVAVLAALAALYIVLDYEGLASRVGMPIGRDLLIGSFLVIILLEGTRRVIGPALPLIALFFTGYAFFGPYMPDFLAFKGVSLNRFVGQIALTTEGIFGIPLDVSPSTPTWRIRAWCDACGRSPSATSSGVVPSSSSARRRWCLRSWPHRSPFSICRCPTRCACG